MGKPKSSDKKAKSSQKQEELGDEGATKTIAKGAKKLHKMKKPGSSRRLMDVSILEACQMAIRKPQTTRIGVRAGIRAGEWAKINELLAMEIMPDFVGMLVAAAQIQAENDKRHTIMVRDLVNGAAFHKKLMYAVSNKS